MRNKKTGKFEAGIHLNGKIKWLLTGTPLQNRLSDFYSLCKICGIDNPKNVDVERLKELYIKRSKINPKKYLKFTIHDPGFGR